MEDVSLKHISSDRFKKLEKQAEEVREEVVQVQGILKAFLEKVGTMAHPTPEPYIFLVAWDELHVSVGGLLGQERAQGRNRSASTGRIRRRMTRRKRKRKERKCSEALCRERCDKKQCDGDKVDL